MGEKDHQVPRWTDYISTEDEHKEKNIETQKVFFLSAMAINKMCTTKL